MKNKKKNRKIFKVFYCAIILALFSTINAHYAKAYNVGDRCSSDTNATCQKAEGWLFSSCPSGYYTASSFTSSFADCGSGLKCCINEKDINEKESYKTPTDNSVYNNKNNPNTSNTYFNQEKIPGAGQTGDFVEYIKQIIRFGFAAIGILALFMLSVGAYQYLMAAANLAKIESAKETISSALLGLVLGLTAFLILRTINPQLVNLQLSSSGGGTGGAGTAQTGTPGGKGTNYGNGNCVEVGSGPCSPENLAGTFGSAANQASIICNYESQGNQMKASKSDLCQDGRSFSWGLFQINLTAHNIGGLNCKDAFSAKNSACTVINEPLYQQCIQAAQDPTTNVNFAKSLYGRNGWGDWARTRKECGL
ncbi:MAG: pilin [Patescibacteria group bacterium]|nr:pilin [Patescibacteria group bacterium]